MTQVLRSGTVRLLQNLIVVTSLASVIDVALPFASDRPSQRCTFPSIHQIRRRFQHHRRTNDNNSSRRHHVEPCNNTILTLDDVSSIYDRRTVTSIQGESNCPDIEQYIEDSAPIQTCPFYYVIEQDEFRIPRAMVQIRCRCRRCIGPRESGWRVCRPQYVYSRVLRVVDCDANGVYQYAEVLEPQSTQCACVTRRWPGRRVMEPYR